MEKKEITFWDRFAFAYDIAQLFNHQVYREMITSIKKIMPENAHVLECAAGTGTISIGIASKAREILCSDLSLPMLKQARKKAKRKKIENITFAERNLQNLPDQKETFDVVIAANVIHLLDHPEDALQELWRVTKKDGLLIIPTFLSGMTKRKVSVLLDLYKIIGFKQKYNFTMPEYKKMLENSGLQTPKIKLLSGPIPAGFAVYKKVQ